MLHERVRENMRKSSGVWARSSSDCYFIFCVGQSIIKQKAFMSFAYHGNIGIKPLIGSYKGQTEQSFIANLDDYDRIAPWLEAEESILLLGACNSDNQPEATLKFLATGQLECLGYLTLVPRDVAFAEECWTLDPFTKSYYICK